MLLLAGCASAAQPAARAAIEIAGGDGPARADWPLQAALPFPRGTVRDPDRLRLTAQGTEVPVQARAASRWPDGSVRWALLDWQADLAPQRTLRFDAVPGQSRPPARRVTVVDEPERVRIDTGVLRFSVPRHAAGFLADVRLGDRAALAAAARTFMVIAGRRVEAGPPASVTVKEPGPLRARIEIRGRYDNAFEYVLRIDAFAGHAFLRVLHSFEQCAPEAHTEVSQIAVDLPLAFDSPASYRMGIEQKPPREGSLPAQGTSLLQADNDTVTVAGTAQPGHAAGWADIAGTADGVATGGVAVAARYFWQEYPQSIALRPGGLTYNMWAPEAGAVRIGTGAAKTHEFVLYFHGVAPPAAAFLDQLARPVAARLDPAWVAGSGALRNLPPPAPRTRTFLAALGAGYDRVRATAQSERWDEAGGKRCPPEPGGERPRRGFFGMLHWGDWNFPGYHDSIKGCDAWGNLEYDLTQVLALAYAATGESKYFEGMVAAARHFMDVDRIHYNDRRPDWVGMNYPKNPGHFGLELGGVDLGHTWTEGLISYSMLTGDARGLEAALGIADFLVRRLAKVIVGGNPRQWGWPQVALVAAYEVTGRDSYKEAAIEYATRGMAAHPPEQIDHWKLGVLAEALTYTHSITGSGAIRDWLTRYAAAVARRAGKEKTDARFLPALAYAGRILQQPEWTRIAAGGLDKLQFGRWAKPFTIAGRLGFSILSNLLPGSADGRAAR